MTTLAGTPSLIRLILRRDRALLPLWTALPALLVWATAQTFAELYPTEAARLAFAAQIEANPTFSGFLGPIFGSSVGALTAWRVGLVMLAAVGIPSLLTIIRHTRTEEEAGRRELIGSTVVGRHAALAAALIVVVGANLLLASLIAASLILSGLPPSGSVALGLSAALMGVVFAALAALAAQSTEFAGTARGMVIGVLGASYMLRFVGDTGVSGLGWLSWLSPMGWAQHSRPFAGERWWVLAMALVLAAATTGVAFVMSSRRDVGAGMIAPRPGPQEASPRLRSPLALGWRLHRGALIGWSVGLLLYGALVGAVAEGMLDLLRENPDLREIFERLGGGAIVTDTFIAFSMGFMALMAAAMSVQAGLRLRSEETGWRAEPLLATGVGRGRWLAGHAAFAVVGPAAALVLAGVGVGLTHGIATGEVARQVPRVVAAGLVQLPAVWVLTGIALALFGLRPRLTGLA